MSFFISRDRLYRYSNGLIQPVSQLKSNSKDMPSTIAEYDGNDQLLRQYVYGPGVDQPVCMIDVNDSNAVYYYHFDGLGSVVALTDAAGDTVQLYEYSVYGQVAASDPNHSNPFLFTGRRMDADTGLYYYRARYYNPYIGRFLQSDPIGYGDGMNIYRYCGNNPWNATDPSGMRPPNSRDQLNWAMDFADDPCDPCTHGAPPDVFGDIPYDPCWPWSDPCDPRRAAFAVAAVIALSDGAEIGLADIIAGGVFAVWMAYMALQAGDDAIIDSCEPCDVHAASRPGNTLGSTGPPNSVAVEDRGGGHGTIREYDENGDAKVDYDFGHHDHHPDLTEPHAHDWERGGRRDWSVPCRWGICGFGGESRRAAS